MTNASRELSQGKLGELSRYKLEIRIPDGKVDKGTSSSNKTNSHDVQEGGWVGGVGWGWGLAAVMFYKCEPLCFTNVNR
jgi:hypothetical protein